MWQLSPSVRILAVVCLLVWFPSAALLSFAAEVDPSTLPVTSELAIRLRDHVQVLASPELQGRKVGTAGNREAAQYIEDEFAAADLEPLPSLDGFRQTISDQMGDNIIGVRPGRSALAQRSWILIGAHYDHLGDGFLGADDNASAVAIMLETARRLGSLTRHSLMFVAFNAEEHPYIRTPLMGSHFFVDHLPLETETPSTFKAVVIMDLMGGVHWAPTRDVIFAMGAEKSPALYRRLKESRLAASGTGQQVAALPSWPLAPRPLALTVLPVGLHLIEEIPVVGHMAFSDYDAFRQAGVPFVFLSSGRTPRYHQTTDLPDTLHYERMAATVLWLHTFIQMIDRDQQPYHYDPDRVEFADELATLHYLVAHAAELKTGIPNTSVLSHWRLQHDHAWLEQLNGASPPTPDTLHRLERISVRIQCLLADFSGCFLF